MSILDIRDSRIEVLNTRKIKKGGYVFYWMQQSQRASENHALEYAIRRADDLGLGVVVGFGMTDTYPEANLRHYTFMLEGLRETQKTLMKRDIQMVVQKKDPVDMALALSADAALVVCDLGYLRHQRKWRKVLSEKVHCQMVQVESDVIIPLKVVSNKAEYAARTIRPKIHRHLENYLVPLKEKTPEKSSLRFKIEGIDLNDENRVLKTMTLDRSIPPVSHFFKGGTRCGKQIFQQFLKHQFKTYAQNRNQPQTDDVSHMSKYLHFGQISPLYLALEVQNIKGASYKEAKETFLEELIVRRELAMNFAYYTPDYDAYTCIPNWSKITLSEHRADKRDYLYSQKELEKANTHDDYWNAAMKEMMITGFMHNYMRMYWGKKILEWSKTPEDAFKTTLALNNKYFLDGRDPNSYTGVAWIYGVHDRAWKERPVFGKIRYMAASGLERKCDINAYIQKVEALEERTGNKS